MRAAAAEACARRLGARRSYYASADSAEDIEALRIRLGAAQIALFAVSYGARVAVECARRYRQRVELMILDSPVAPDAPEALARETLVAVPRVLHALCSSYCYGPLRAHAVGDLRRLVARLRRAPIRHALRRGRHATVTIGVDDLVDLLRAGDLAPAFMARIPIAVRAALAGDNRLLVRLKLTADSSDTPPVTDLNPTLTPVTICEETPLSWDSAASPAARKLQARAALDDGAHADLSGDLDLSTPLESARRLAAALRGRVIVERGAGHFALMYGYYGCTPRPSRPSSRDDHCEPAGPEKPDATRGRAAAPATIAPRREA